MQLKQIKQPAIVVFAAIIFSGVAWLLHHELKKYHLNDIAQSIRSIPLMHLFMAGGLTLLSYWVLTFYDYFALRYIQRKLPYAKVLLVSFTSYVMSYNIGLSAIGGTAVRYRLYSSWGLSGVEIAKVIVFCSLSFWLGFCAMCGLALIGQDIPVPSTGHLSSTTIQVIGFVLILIPFIYLLISWKRKQPITLRSWKFSLPNISTSLALLSVSCIDLTLAGGVLYCLLPSSELPFLLFLGSYFIAMFSGMLSHVPGGLGVFEAVLMFCLKDYLSGPTLIASLLAYRGIYYLAPLALTLIILGVYELINWRKKTIAIGLRIGNYLPLIIPRALSITTFSSGIALLLSGATPSIAGRLRWLSDILPLPVLEVSHFLGSVIGVALLFLARGLHRRIDSAYWLSLIITGIGFALALLKGEFGAAAFVLLTFIFLLPCRKYFYRRGSLFHQPLSLEWSMSIIILIGLTILIGYYSYQHVQYTDQLWWKFSINGDAPRFLRASVGIVITLIIVYSARWFGTARLKPQFASTEEIEKANAIIQQSNSTIANLALLGDKALLFSPSEKSFIMYQIEGNSWIALGDPTGDESEFEALIWRFREVCDQYGDHPAFYNVKADYMNLYLDCGLTLTKIGEEGRAPIHDFSLQGGMRKGLRSTVSKVEKEGCSFHIITVEEIPNHLPRFKEISDCWLSDKDTGEKGFSLGFYNEAYLKRYPAAVIKKDDKIIAFANIWPSSNKEELSIDLMRYTEDAPRSVMEYLFTQLMLWGQQQGYRYFSLGSTPLSGMESHALAPTWHKFGNFLFTHGERFYNFQGLRQYKEKFDPEWHPRYIASRGGMQLPRILTNIATLISGGWKELFVK